MKFFQKMRKRIRRRYFPTDFDKELSRWFRDDGDYYSRLKYDLNEESTVLDLGGFKGQFASDLFAKYQCNILVFEPIKEYFEFIEERFSKNDKIQVFQFALGDADKKEFFYLDNDGTSINNKSGKSKSDRQEVVFRDIELFFRDQGIRSVDLVKINIEGGEYDLLEYLLEKNMINIFRNIQVQFHKYIANSDRKMSAIQTKLEDTHYLSWQYRFVWENWVKR